LLSDCPDRAEERGVEPRYRYVRIWCVCGEQKTSLFCRASSGICGLGKQQKHCRGHEADMHADIDEVPGDGNCIFFGTERGTAQMGQAS